MEANVLEQVMAQFAETRRHFDGIAERLDANQQRLEQGVDELRRHFDVVAERLEARQKLLAADLARLGTKLDNFEREVRHDMRKHVGEIRMMLRLLGPEVAREHTAA